MFAAYSVRNQYANMPNCLALKAYTLNYIYTFMYMNKDITNLFETKYSFITCMMHVYCKT